MNAALDDHDPRSARFPTRLPSSADGSGSGLGDRLAALIAWARVDVPAAALAADHAHAEDLLGRSASRYQRADALWAVWPPQAAPLRASPHGPVYRLDGVVSRPRGGGLTTHAVVAAQTPEGAMWFAVGVRHPRVHVLSDMVAAAGSPVGSSGAVRFDGVPATTLQHPGPCRDRMRRLLCLTATALVVGAAAGVAAEGRASAAGCGVRSPHATGALGRLARQVVAVACAIDEAGRGRCLPGVDAQVAEVGAQAREAAADLVAWTGRAGAHPGSPLAARVGQLELAQRLDPGA